MFGIDFKEIVDDKYKYALLATYICQTKYRPVDPIKTKFIELTINGVLTILKDYQWDGPSGISIDTDNFMRGSLVHDSLYQLMDEGYLCKKGDRLMADRLLRRICRSDGMSWFRSWYVFRVVRIFGGLYVKRKNT